MGTNSWQMCANTKKHTYNSSGTSTTGMPAQIQIHRNRNYENAKTKIRQGPWRQAKEKGWRIGHFRERAVFAKKVNC